MEIVGATLGFHRNLRGHVSSVGFERLRLYGKLRDRILVGSAAHGTAAVEAEVRIVDSVQTEADAANGRAIDRHLRLTNTRSVGLSVVIAGARSYFQQRRLDGARAERWCE